VVLLNTGSNPRPGPGRLHVALARHLAGLGAIVVRVDLAGIGDTPIVERDGDEEVSPYGQAAIRDVQLLTEHLRQLARHDGHGQVVLVGTCSGAWAAYHAAQLDGPVPDRIVLLNQMIHDDASWAGEGETPAMAFKARHELGQAFRSLDKWKRLAKGELHLGPNVRRLSVWAGLRARQAIARARGAHLSVVEGQLQRISRRGVAQLHVFDEPESGLAYLRLHAAALLDGPARPPGMELVTMSGTGHTFGPLAAQAGLAALLAEHLLGDGPRSSELTGPGAADPHPTRSVAGTAQ
jgi:hypothetical protein